GSQRSSPGLIDELGLEQDLASCLHSRLGHEHISGTSSQIVGHVEPHAPSQQAGDTLLEQQTLDELGFRLVARARDANERALAELRLDLPRPPVAFADGGARGARVGIGERHPAHRAEALVRGVGGAAARTDQRLARDGPPRHHSTSSSASATCPSRMVYARTSAPPLTSPTITYRASG